jgi:hypothetical protein
VITSSIRDRAKIDIGLPAKWLFGIAALLAVAVFPVQASAGTAAIDNSVQLDPFNPVPEIQFSRDCYDACGGCGDRCGSRCEDNCGRHCYRDCDRWHVGWRDCDRDCRYGSWYCERGCRNNWYGTGWRDCDRDCREGSWHCARGCAVSYRHLLRDYDERVDRHDDQADRYDEQADRYDEQAEWYKHHVIDKDRWYDGHTWHISPLRALTDIMPRISVSIGPRDHDGDDDPHHDGYGAPRGGYGAPPQGYGPQSQGYGPPRGGYGPPPGEDSPPE